MSKIERLIHKNNSWYFYVKTHKIGYTERQYGKYAKKLALLSLETKERILNYIVISKKNPKKAYLKLYTETFGYHTSIIDTEDIEKIQKYKWYLNYDRHNDRYTVRASINGKLVFLHRYIMGVEDESPTIYIDHKDRNSLNNRKKNLRITTNSINQRNKGLQKNNTSGIAGVRLNPKINSWTSVYVDLNGKRHTRTFSVAKYGDEEAKRLAIENRIKNCNENEYLGVN